MLEGKSRSKIPCPKGGVRMSPDSNGTTGTRDGRTCMFVGPSGSTSRSVKRTEKKYSVKEDVFSPVFTGHFEEE